MDVRDAMRVFVSQPNLAALVVAGCNPELDADGSGVRRLIDLLGDVLAAKLEEQPAATTAAPTSSESANQSETDPGES